jgi:hypothetical protein
MLGRHGESQPVYRELVALRIGQNDPARFALSNVDMTGTHVEQALHLAVAIIGSPEPTMTSSVPSSSSR